MVDNCFVLDIPQCELTTETSTLRNHVNDSCSDCTDSSDDKIDNESAYDIYQITGTDTRKKENQYTNDGALWAEKTARGYSTITKKKTKTNDNAKTPKNPASSAIRAISPISRTENKKSLEHGHTNPTKKLSKYRIELENFKSTESHNLNKMKGANEVIKTCNLDKVKDAIWSSSFKLLKDEDYIKLLLKSLNSDNSTSLDDSKNKGYNDNNCNINNSNFSRNIHCSNNNNRKSDGFEGSPNREPPTKKSIFILDRYFNNLRKPNAEQMLRNMNRKKVKQEEIASNYCVISNVDFEQVKCLQQPFCTVPYNMQKLHVRSPDFASSLLRSQSCRLTEDLTVDSSKLKNNSLRDHIAHHVQNNLTRIVDENFKDYIDNGLHWSQRTRRIKRQKLRQKITVNVSRCLCSKHSR